MQNRDIDKQIADNPELNELLNPPKSRTLLVASLIGFGLMLVAGVASMIIAFSFHHEGGGHGFHSDEGAGSYSSDSEEPGSYSLVEISPGQAKTWLQENISGMNALSVAAGKHKLLRNVWIASSYDYETNKIFVWINDIPCTDNPAHVGDEGGEERYLFSEVLKDVDVSVIDFYEIVSFMKNNGIEGYELYEGGSGSELAGASFFHESYDGAFYFSFDGKAPAHAGPGHELADKWWFIEP